MTQKNIEFLQAKINGLEEDLIFFKNENHRLRAENVDLADTVREYEEKIADLENKLKND